MFSISQPITNAADAVAYYLDYYTDGTHGRFSGAGADFLELPAQVTREMLLSLFQGYSPQGYKPLVKNAGDDDRTCGWDFTFSDPKPYSALWAILPEPERKVFEAMHRETVDETLKVAEEMYGVVRRGKGGKDHQKARLTFAVFDEFTSRANNMQMHSHCVLVNTGVTADGKTGALHSINFFRAKMLLGAVFTTGLAAKVSQRYNLVVTPEKAGFGIQGVPKDFCRSQSKRRIAIEKIMKARGLVSAQAAKIVAKDSRPAKQNVALEKLFPVWQQAARDFGWGPEPALKLLQSQPQKITLQQTFEAAAKKAVAQLGQEAQTAKNILRTVKNTAIEHGVSGARFVRALEEIRLPNGASLVYEPAHKAKKTTPKKAPKQPATKEASPSTEHTSPEATKKHTGTPTPPTGEPQSEKPVWTNPEFLPVPKLPPGTSQPGERTNSGPKTARPIGPQKLLGGTGAQPQIASGEKASAGNNSNGSRRRAGGQKTDSEKTSSKKTDSKKAYRPSRAQQRRNLEFTRQFGAWVDRIWAERQTRDRLTRLAHVLAKRYGADQQTLHRTLDEMKPGAERSFVHIKNPRIFADSPLDSFKWIRVPKIAVGDKQPTWGKIYWTKRLPIGEIRIQAQRLFTKAPKWSPFHRLEIPALRFSLKRSESESKQKSKPTGQRTKIKQQSKKKDQSQSH